MGRRNIGYHEWGYWDDTQHGECVTKKRGTLDVEITIAVGDLLASMAKEELLDKRA